MLAEMSNTIEQARDNSIQITARDRNANVHGVTWLARAGLGMTEWWSEKRDLKLRNFWKKSDHLSGAVYALTSKMTAIPFSVQPKDSTNDEHIAQANMLTELLRSTTQFGEGWQVFFGRWVEDLVTTDNGAFAEIIGPGDPTGPLTGPPISIAHLDSLRCVRTSDPLYPVLYRDDDGKLYKLHYTRVLYASQMSSPSKEMNGVGFCAVSRCINVAQTLIDILTFKQEKMGSRPHRAILVTKGGLDPKDVADAFAMAEGSMDNQKLSRYSKVVVTGSAAIEEAGLEVVELSKLPDGFEERTSIELGMATIALAFGMDARELFPGMTAGATRADALLQHLKQRGKGPGQVIELVENLFNNKFLPPHMRFVFDFQDDAQDRQTAEIRKVRSERVNVELLNGVIQQRTARQQMLASGDIDRGQFELLELNDGRLENGADLLSVLYNPHPRIKQYADLGVDDPLDYANNDPESMVVSISKQANELRKLAGQRNTDHLQRLEEIKLLTALEQLKRIYLAIYRSGAQTPIDRLIAAEAYLQELTDKSKSKEPTAGREMRREETISPSFNNEATLRAGQMDEDEVDDEEVDKEAADTIPFW